MRFRSRISTLLVCFTLALLAFVAYHSIISGDLEAVIMVCFLTVIISCVIFGLRYDICETTLTVSLIGLFRQHYDLTKLKSITGSRTLLSSPAASLKRIKLDFGCGHPLIISPANQDVFIEEILRINPNVQVEV